MKVIIYVEGSADELAFETLFQSLIAEKAEDGKAIQFTPAPIGHNKEMLLKMVPANAVSILMGDPEAIVVALPDLYPPNIEFPHRDYEELRDGMYACFQHELDRRHIDDARLKDRFHVFCSKYDLEALILASESALTSELGLTRLRREDKTWIEPVEDQNHNKPPKYIVMELFKKHGKKYFDTIAAPNILGSMDYQILADRCPQCFKPFVEFLTGL